MKTMMVQFGRRRTPFVICLLTLCSAIVLSAMQNQSAWIPIHDVRFTAIPYPPAAKNNAKETICTFTAVVKSGIFIHAELSANQNANEFPISWFNNAINSIRLDSSCNLRASEFQFRFAPAASIIVSSTNAKSPVSLWYRK